MAVVQILFLLLLQGVLLGSDASSSSMSSPVSKKEDSDFVLVASDDSGAEDDPFRQPQEKDVVKFILRADYSRARGVIERNPLPMSDRFFCDHLSEFFKIAFKPRAGSHDEAFCRNWLCVRLLADATIAVHGSAVVDTVRKWLSCANLFWCYENSREWLHKCICALYRLMAPGSPELVKSYLQICTDALGKCRSQEQSEAVYQFHTKAMTDIAKIGEKLSRLPKQWVWVS